MGEEGKGRAHLCGEVLEDGGEVDGRAGADALRVLAGLEEARDAADGELQPGLGRPRDRLGPLRLAPSSAGTHLPEGVGCSFAGSSGRWPWGGRTRWNGTEAAGGIM
jgi:hypothetical protein